jgi:hypothetical protein
VFSFLSYIWLESVDGSDDVMLMMTRVTDEDYHPYTRFYAEVESGIGRAMVYTSNPRALRPKDTERFPPAVSSQLIMEAIMFIKKKKGAGYDSQYSSGLQAGRPGFDSSNHPSNKFISIF